MNAYLRNHMAAVFLSLPVATAMVVLPSAVMAQTDAPELRSLKISSNSGLGAGAELGFTVEGTARAKSHVRVEGINRDIILKETARGIYTGTYTILSQDRVVQTSQIRAFVQVGNRNVIANYTFPVGMATAPSADASKAKAKAKAEKGEAKALMLLNMQPLLGSNTPRRPIIPISASFEAKGGVNPKSVHILVSGRDVTSGSKITSESFIYRANLKPGRHMVDVTATDAKGNKLHKNWTFNITDPAAPSSTKAERCE